MPPVTAIISDIHGNLEALLAVLADAAHHGADRIICLGDLVGYGPDPLECVMLSMAWPVVVQGNFDFAAISRDDLGGWSARAAARSVLWFRTLLHGSDQGRQAESFLAARPLMCGAADLVFVHGTPRNPRNEYVFPECVTNLRKMHRIGESFRRYCFNGHSHVPGVLVEEGPLGWQYLSPQECCEGYRLDGRKTICNVGSVGKPRDQDWRACYALFDGEWIRFRRVSYDVETTIAKIHANPELDDFLGDMLRLGT